MLAHFVDWILALIKPMGVSISECDSLFKSNPSSFLLSKCQIGGVVGPMDHIRDALWIPSRVLRLVVIHQGERSRFMRL